MNMDEKQKHQLMFIQLVKTFESAAWIQMGKIKNPQTDKLERDLLQAQYSIDMLDMLKAKTEGNLSDEESRMLNEILTNLKLNFVEELEKEKKEKAEREKAKAEQKAESGVQAEKAEGPEKSAETPKAGGEESSEEGEKKQE